MKPDFFLTAILAIILIAGLSGCAKTDNPPNPVDNDSGTAPVQPPVQKPEPKEDTQKERAPQPPALPAETSPKDVVVADHTIEFTSEGFVPGKLTIKQGETVTWVNKTPAPVWPASAKHPTHTAYPGVGYNSEGSYQGSLGCTAEGKAKAGAFDPCKGLAEGGSWSFTFTQAGAWFYHDHLNVTKFGQVVVEGAEQEKGTEGTNTAPPAPLAAPQAAPATQTEAVKEFNVTAKNWAFEPAQITVNRGDKVKLTIKSTDVTHGFFLPAFNVSKSLEPGKEIVAEFTADQAGEFPFYCNVFCGSGHSDMKGKLIVK